MHLNDNKNVNNIHSNIYNIEKYNNENHNDESHNDNNMFTRGQQSCNRTLIVGPSFCGKTHLLLNKLQLFLISVI